MLACLRDVFAPATTLSNMPDPAAILSQMSDTYAACTSYRDQGVVITTFHAAHGKRTDRLPFSTRFVRDQGFLFEFRKRRGEDDWDQLAVWTENGRSNNWWSIAPDRPQRDTLELALAGATGVSGGSAHRVPHLLMPELRGTRQSPPRPSRIIAVPEAEAQNCIVIERPQSFGNVEQIWIDQSTFAIRRVIEPRHSLGPPPPDVMEQLKAAHPEHAAHLAKHFGENRQLAEVEEVTEYEPAFDVQIPPADLIFIPPPKTTQA
jgi:hypothetical protein